MLQLKEKISLKDYQIQAVDFCTSRPASLLSMKTGTGKSVIIIKSSADLINSGNATKVIVLCTKSSMIEVENDFKDKLQYDDGYCFNPCIIADNQSLDYFFKSKDEDIALLQYEKLKQINLRNLAKHMHAHKVALMLDESHKVKNPKAMITQMIIALRKYMEYLIFLTATPITSSLVDFFWQIHILDKNIFINKTTFMNNFVETRVVKNFKTGLEYSEIVKYKNLETFRDRIKPVCFDYYPIQQTKYIVHKTKIENVSDYIEASAGLFKAEEDDIKNHSARLVDLQHVVDMSKNKIKTYLKVIQPYLKDGLITYCHFHKTIDILSKVLSHLNIDYRVIHGQISTKERKEIKKWFNDNPSNKVLLISSAGSQSLNLQSVNNMFFYNIPSGYGAFSQAKGRIERLFSNFKDFNIHLILTEFDYKGKTVPTVDWYKYELLSAYGEITTTVLNAQEVPKSRLVSFNKAMINSMKKTMLWVYKNIS